MNRNSTWIKKNNTDRYGMMAFWCCYLKQNAQNNNKYHIRVITMHGQMETTSCTHIIRKM